MPENYFDAYEGYFWEWNAEDRAISIYGNITIGYFKLLLEYLEPVTFQGLPRFSAFLAVFAMTNKNAIDCLAAIRANYIENVEDVPGKDEQIESAMRILGYICEIPIDIRSKRKLDLLRVLFQLNLGKYSLTPLPQIIGEAKKEDFEITTSPLTKDVHNSDLHALKVMCIPFRSSHDIIEAIYKLPKPDLSLDAPETKDPDKTLLEQLDEIELTSPSVALVKSLWSGLQLPPHQSLMSQQAFGGIADITNKGQLDKLLISEYANDEIVFLSRIANNEVLFLQRETPPQPDNLHRVVLIDSSIKSWGTPRTVGLGILLSLVQHPKQKMKIYGFCIGDDYSPIQLDTAYSIVDTAFELSTSLDPSTGLSKFLDEHGSRTTTETIFVCSPEQLINHGILKLIAENSSQFHYLITVDSKGIICLHRNSRKGLNLLRKFQVPLKELWGSTKVMPAKRTVGSEILLSPLLFPKPLGKFRIARLHSEIFIINKNILYSFRTTDVPKHGLKRLDFELPVRKNAYYALGRKTNGELLMLCFEVSKREATIANLVTNDLTNFEIPEAKGVLDEISFQGSSFLLPTEKNTYEIDILAGQVKKHPEHPLSNRFALAHKEYIRLKKDVNRMYMGAHPNAKIIMAAITNQGQLRINKHVLEIINDGIMFSLNAAATNKLIAERFSADTHRFKDGSEVIFDDGGQIRLKSSDKSIPEIIVVSILQTNTAICTESCFAGNVFYRDDSRDQDTLYPADFFKKYLNRFIQTILQV